MKRAAFDRGALLLLGLTLAACATAPALPTLAPTPFPTQAPTATSSRTPTLSPSPQPTVRPSPTPSPTPTLPPISPVATAHGLWITGWSPDSRWLAYRSFTPEDASQNPYEGTSILPYGTFHVLDVRTGVGCHYPKDNAYDLQFNMWYDWLPDSRLMTLDLAGAVVALEDLCDGATASVMDAQSRPPCLVTNTDSNQTCSPDGNRLATTIEAYPSYTTTVVSTATGEVEAVVSWPHSQDGIGHVGGPFWLDNDRFIIHATDEGPLLVTLAAGAEAEVQPIAPTFFGLPGKISQAATGVQAPGSLEDHLLLHEYASETGDGRVLLYHPENGIVEAFEAAYAQLSPDGRWLELHDQNQTAGWLRSVDPPHGVAAQFLTEDDQGYTGWSRDWSLLALTRRSIFNGLATVGTYAMPETRLLETWSIGRYTPGWPVWSPDARYLALVGYPSVGEPALFVIDASK